MPTIAEQINLTLKTVTDWTDQYTATYGIVFNKVDKANLDNAITRYANEGDWQKVLTMKRKAEIVGYSSPTIDEKVKQALTNIGQFTCKLPKMADGWWYNWYYHLLDCFRYAKELNHETDKWDDPAKAFRGLWDLRTTQTKYFYRCNPDTGTVERIGEGRWHQASALAGTWMKFYELGVRDAVYSILHEWEEFNRIYWSINHYIYRTDYPDYEVRFGSVFQTWVKAYRLHPFAIPENFPRITGDLTVRCLLNLWLSPQWGGKNVVVHHYPKNLEQRLDGTLEGWAVLHMFYPLFSEGIKSNMRDMLLGKGVVKASDALLASDLFNPATNRFRMTDTWSYSDRASCFGAAALFLMAITPDTASLAIPVRAEGIEMYEADFFDPHHFEFNYEAKKIKIPVYAGKLTLTFGEKPVEAKFPADGIYAITFTDDWGGITSITRVGDLDQTYLKLPHVPTPTEAAVALLVTTLGSIPLYHLGKTLIRKVKEAG